MANALFGTKWKMDPAKTIFSTDFSPSTETRLYEEIPNGYKLTVEGTHKGAAYRWGYTAVYDGQGHPVYGRNDVDSITAYKVDDKVTIGLFKQNTVDGGAYARILADDSKTLIVQAAGRNANGMPYYDVTTYSV